MHHSFVWMSGRNKECRCPWQFTPAPAGLGISRSLSGESSQVYQQKGLPGDAGLKHLDIAFVQPAAASLSSSLGALTCLTFLALDRLLSLKQEGGCSGGALSSLLLRLCCLNLQASSARAHHAKRASCQDWHAGRTCSQQPASICTCLSCTYHERHPTHFTRPFLSSLLTAGRHTTLFSIRGLQRLKDMDATGGRGPGSRDACALP